MLWYTGEAIQGEEFGDLDDDEDEGDTDEDDEDDDDEEDEEEEDEDEDEKMMRKKVLCNNYHSLFL